MFNARINDIQVARDGETISILVKLSQQPGAATVKSTGEGLTLEVDGLVFNTLHLSPPSGSLVTRVEAASGKLTLSGVAFSNPTTTIYRNAVMIEAKLAEPRLQAATSIMGATVAPNPPPVVSQQAAPAPVPVKAVQPVAPAPQTAAPVHAPKPVAVKAVPTPAPAPTATAVTNPAPASAPVATPMPAATPVSAPVKAVVPTPVAVAPEPVAQPVHLTTATPITPTPVALAPAEAAPHAKHEAEDQLQSHPVPAAPAPAPVAIAAAAPAPAAPTTATAMAGIDAARCSTAADELAKDAWALAAMGDHALCLIDAGKLDEAKNRIDQLAAITPQDWRVALGRAKLAEKAGDTETAQVDFVSASLAAPDDAVRETITERVSATPDDKETDIELPLPTAPAPAPTPKAAAKPAH